MTRTRTFVLTINDSPKSVNHGGGGARANPYAAHREKKRWEERYLLELLAARVPLGMRSCTAAITLRWRRRNRRDPENYRHPIVKPLADALVRVGYLPDDTAEYFHVDDVTFEYPDEWPSRDPRSRAELVITLTATYDA